jgi:hypothetical protein
MWTPLLVVDIEYEIYMIDGYGRNWYRGENLDDQDGIFF